MRVKLIPALSLLLLSCAAPLWADSVLPADCSVTPGLCQATATTGGKLGMNVGYPYPGDIVDYSSPLGTSDSHAINGSWFGYAGSASGSIVSGFDGIHTSLTAQGAPFAPNGFETTTANATGTGYIDDLFETADDVPVGSLLEITYTVDATAIASKYGNAYVESGLQIDGQVAPLTCTNGSGVSSFVGAFATSCSTLVPISSLDIIAVSLNFGAGIGADDNNPVLLDASNTAKVSSAVLVDSNGDPLSGVQLYDASGYDYNSTLISTGSPVPEPSSLALLGTGCFGFAAAAYRKRVTQLR